MTPKRACRECNNNLSWICAWAGFCIDKITVNYVIGDSSARELKIWIPCNDEDQIELMKTKAVSWIRNYDPVSRYMEVPYEFTFRPSDDVLRKHNVGYMELDFVDLYTQEND